MNCIEVNNLTLDPDRVNDYLIVLDDTKPILRNHKFPLSMGRLDLVWVVKFKEIYTPMNLIPFIDLTQEEYDALIEYDRNTLYRIRENGEIVKLYFNGIAYKPGDGEIKQLSLINDATIYMDPEGILYKSILGIDNTNIFMNDDGVLYNSVMGTSDTKLNTDIPAYGTITNASQNNT
jgi:hypothetical protein